MPKPLSRIVLACDGDLDTSVAVPWLAARYDAQVVTLTLDLGQGGELTDIRERALAAGAVRAHVIDAREEFVREYIMPALQAGALDERQAPIAAALARAAIAKRLIEVARMEAASGVAHGGQEDVVSPWRESLRALDPAITVIAPAQAWQMAAAAQVESPATRHVSIPVSPRQEIAVRMNVWGRSITREALHGQDEGPASSVYTMTRSVPECPDEPAYVDIEFVQGAPLRANGIELPILELIESLDIIGGAHGVGRSGAARSNGAGHATTIEEAPAARLLQVAHRALEAFVTDRDLLRAREAIAHDYGDMIRRGRWFSHDREPLDAVARHIQTRLTGSVRMMLFKGECRVVGRRSPFVPNPHAPTANETVASFDRATAHGLAS